MVFKLKASVRMLRIIYFALITGVILFQIVVFSMFDFIIPEFKAGLDPINLASIMLLIFFPVGYIVSSKIAEKILPAYSSQQKMAILQSAFIVRWAIIEGTALFSIVGMLMLEDGKQLIVFLISLLLFAMTYPSTDRIVSMGKLSEKERRELES